MQLDLLHVYTHHLHFALKPNSFKFKLLLFYVHTTKTISCITNSTSYVHKSLIRPLHLIEQQTNHIGQLMNSMQDNLGMPRIWPHPKCSHFGFENYRSHLAALSIMGTVHVLSFVHSTTPLTLQTDSLLHPYNLNKCICTLVHACHSLDCHKLPLTIRASSCSIGPLPPTLDVFFTYAWALVSCSCTARNFFVA
jgi:hypothetical protein